MNKYEVEVSCTSLDGTTTIDKTINLSALNPSHARELVPSLSEMVNHDNIFIKSIDKSN